MSFGGHVMDMIARVKYNESLKKSRREHYARIKEAYAEGIRNKEPHLLKEKKISKEELEKIKYQIRVKIRRERFKNITTSISFTIIVIFISIIVVRYALIFFKDKF
jgi:hypothetical protein